MVIMRSGYYPNTYFVDRYWQNAYWLNSELTKYIYSDITVIDPLTSTGTVSGLGSSPGVTNVLNNDWSIR